MEAEKKEIPEKRSSPNTGEQYLIALIKCADWVARPYKQLCEKHRMNIEVLKELYLCACDGVPIEKALEAQEKEPLEGALRLLRQKHLENTAMDNYKGSITTLKKEVEQMSAVLQHIADHVPDFDSMFPEKESEGQEPEKLVLGSQKEQTLSEWDVPESGTKKAKISRWFPWAKKRETADFIKKLLEADYSREQMEYILDCIEDGLSPKYIQRFTSPKLPVDVMRRLRVLEERKEKNKWNKTEM